MIVAQERQVLVTQPFYLAVCENCGQTEEAPINRVKKFFDEKIEPEYPRGWLVVVSPSLGFCRWLCVSEYAKSQHIEAPTIEEHREEVTA